MSGTTVVELHEDELHSTVGTWKLCQRLLADRIGYSRFRQRLFSEGIGELTDDMCLRPLLIVQLTVQRHCATDETSEEELLCKCQGNSVSKIEQLLRTPQDPNPRGGTVEPA